MIVALTRLGVDAATEITSYVLAESVPGIDVIIDGHSHTVMDGGELRNNVLITSTGENSGSLGVVNITLDADRSVTAVTAELQTVEEAATLYPTPDAATEALVAAINEEQAPILNEVVGSIANTLGAERGDVRTKEMPIGNLVADALLEGTGADIAFTNGGGLRATLEVGEITKGDLYAMLLTAI